MSSIVNPNSGLLSDVITWVRRIIKAPLSSSISDATIGDYINRFYNYDMAARLQLFELKRQFTFELQANIDQYQFDFSQYQMLSTPCYVDGILLGFFTNTTQFYNIIPDMVQNQILGTADGTVGPFTLTASSVPIIRGFKDDLNNVQPYVFVSTNDANGNQMTLADDGQGNLYSYPLANPGEIFTPVVGTEFGTVNYLTGAITASFPSLTTSGANIYVQSNPYTAGYPRWMLFFNNILKFRPVPDKPYKFTCDTFLTPSKFLDTVDSVPFAYMSEYIARGAARKILSDNGDYEQFQFYEPLFREQENLVVRRTDRQASVNRTPSIFSAQVTGNPQIFVNY